MSDDRETKIIASIAVLEYQNLERHAAIKRAHTRLDDHDSRLREIELKIASQLWVERGIWVVASAAISYFLSR